MTIKMGPMELPVFYSSIYYEPCLADGKIRWLLSWYYCQCVLSVFEFTEAHQKQNAR